MPRNSASTAVTSASETSPSKARENIADIGDTKHERQSAVIEIGPAGSSRRSRVDPEGRSSTTPRRRATSARRVRHFERGEQARDERIDRSRKPVNQV